MNVDAVGCVTKQNSLVGLQCDNWDNAPRNPGVAHVTVSAKAGVNGSCTRNLRQENFARRSKFGVARNEQTAISNDIDRAGAISVSARSDKGKPVGSKCCIKSSVR